MPRHQHLPPRGSRPVLSHISDADHTLMDQKLRELTPEESAIPITRRDWYRDWYHDMVNPYIPDERP